MASRLAAFIARDEGRYLRRRRNGTYQARPVRAGRRFDLGHFYDAREAAGAVREFMACRDPLSYPELRMRFVVAVHSRRFTVYWALLPDGRRSRFDFRDEAEGFVRDALGWATLDLYSVPTHSPKREAPACAEGDAAAGPGA